MSAPKAKGKAGGKGPAGRASAAETVPPTFPAGQRDAKSMLVPELRDSDVVKETPGGKQWTRS